MTSQPPDRHSTVEDRLERHRRGLNVDVDDVSRLRLDDVAACVEQLPLLPILLQHVLCALAELPRRHLYHLRHLCHLRSEK